MTKQKIKSYSEGFKAPGGSRIRSREQYTQGAGLNKNYGITGGQKTEIPARKLSLAKLYCFQRAV